MRGRGLLQRALATPACRALAILGAWVVAMEAMQLPLLTVPEPPSCCCGHRSADARCRCRVCTHAREVESGTPVLKTCGSGAGAPAVVSVSRDPAFPAVEPAPQALAAPPRLDLRSVCKPPDPPSEVPTPPPLARS